MSVLIQGILKNVLYNMFSTYCMIRFTD